MPQAWIPFLIVLFSTAALSAANAASNPGSPSQCVDVQIGNDRTPYLNCLNEQLQKSVGREHGTPPTSAPLSAASPSNQVGTFNEAAARQRMGNAFGTSPAPQRPPKPVFVSPVLPVTPR